MFAGGGIPGDLPLTPRRGAERLTELGLLPRPVVNLHLNFGDPIERGPGHTSDHALARRKIGGVAGSIDT